MLHLADAENVEVRGEDPTNYIKRPGRRIDVTLLFDNSFRLGIENKPFSGEQEDQINDYCKHLESQSRPFLLLYLSREGSDPESIGPEVRERLKRDRKLANISYREELSRWLEGCIRSCRAERVTHFLEDFQEFINTKFPNEGGPGRMTDLTAGQLIQDVALECEHNLRIALQVHEAYDLIRRRLVESFYERLEHHFSSLGTEWEVFRSPRDQILRQYSKFHISKRNWNGRWLIGLEAADNGPNTIWLGVIKGAESTEFIPGLWERLNEEFRLGQQHPWWEWRALADREFRYWHTEDNLIRLYQKDALLEYFCSQISRIKEVATPVIDQFLKSGK